MPRKGSTGLAGQFQNLLSLWNRKDRAKSVSQILATEDLISDAVLIFFFF